jgi:hypothetical protein
MVGVSEEVMTFFTGPIFDVVIIFLMPPIFL